MMMELDEEVIRMTDTAERPAYRPGMRPGMPGFPKPPERPVTLQRRESGIGNRESGQPEAGNREQGTGNRPAPESGVRGAAQPPTPQPPQPQPPSPIGEESGAAPAANGGAEGARPRRRRGRRGGRRGRGRGDGTATPNGGVTDVTSADAAENDGNNGSDEEGDGE